MLLFMGDLILAMTKADEVSARVNSDWQVEQKIEQLRLILPLADCDRHHLDSVGEVRSSHEGLCKRFSF